MTKPKRVFLVLFIAIGLASVLAFRSMIRRGFSARDQPSSVEAYVARRMRQWAIPARAKKMKNPFADSAEAVMEGRAHFADHCASCHGNDGRGKTEIGRNLYPKAPDMWGKDTQSLSDGELFYIIKNGVRLTGMPAWGKETAEDDQASWHLVSFIRHLPWITPEELDKMEAMNPVNPMELKEREAEERFLEGTAESPSRPTAVHKH